MRRKELLAAGLVRDIRFCDDMECDLYFGRLNNRKVEYKILDTFLCADGSIIIRILQQYNNVPLIQLFDE